VTAGRFEVAHLDDLQRFEGEIVTIPVRIPLGISSFGVNAYAAGKGGEVIEEHDELGAGAGRHEELYCVVRGHASFELDGREVDAPAGTFVFVNDPAVRRHATAKAPDTTVLVVGGVPEQAFEPSPWEAWLEALPRFEAGDYAGAIEVMARALEKHPDNYNVLYNLACAEARAGEVDSALEHLSRAVELEPRARAWAQADEDFASIRSDPRFPTKDD
jgi:tetratricopeptide (TPR) repeat protein